MIPSAPPSAPAGRPHLPAAGVALGLFSESVAHRAELATLELAEAREHATVSALLAGAAGLFALLTGFAATLLLAGLVWDLPQRAWWLGGLAAAYLATAFTAGFLLARRLRSWRPLGATQEQLQQDYQCLNRLIRSIAS
jgi:uncharacterized membrane protein YqjE